MGLLGMLICDLLFHRLCDGQQVLDSPAKRDMYARLSKTMWKELVEI